MSSKAKPFLQRVAFLLKYLAFVPVAMGLASVPAATQQAQPKQNTSQATQQAQPKQNVSQASQQPQEKSFASPQDAAAALATAVRNDDEPTLVAILGSEEVIRWTSDAEERQADYQQFAQKYDQMHRLVKEPDGTTSLYVGAENWPLPFSLIERNSSWHFDTGAGEREILYRRIGQNELDAMEVCRALADAEKDYYANAHQYAQKLMSTGNSHDGLYWAGSNSAIGPSLAHAGASGAADANRAPFYGYYYRILLLQGADAPAGPRNYIDNGKMTGGFAILAFPAEYRSSGVMTFEMGDNGAIYEKDLGPMTDQAAQQISQYNPDKTWKKSQ